MWLGFIVVVAVEQASVAASIRPLVWELPYTAGAAVKEKKKGGGGGGRKERIKKDRKRKERKKGKRERKGKTQSHLRNIYLLSY